MNLFEVHHIENKHEGIRYPCLECDFVSTSAGGLKIHIDSNQGLRYNYDKCEYSVAILRYFQNTLRVSTET